MSPSVDAVTFDFWNTLLVPRDEHTSDARAASMIAALAEAGVEVARDELDRAFVDLFEIFNQHWAENRQFTARHASSLVIERLGATDLDGSALERVHDAFGDAASDSVPPLAPNAAEVLEALKGAGVRIGIVCDVGMTPSTVLRRYLDRYGLLGHFDHWSFSDEVGVYKPHREIFEHALGGLGVVEPGRAAHVGDLRRTDVAGARGMGMTAVRYRAVNDDSVPDDGGEAVEGDHVLDDHLDLIRVLDLD